MKNVSLLTLGLIFIGCMNYKEMSRSTILTGWDFRECTRNNFMVTPEAPYGDYDAVGIFTIDIFPTVKEVTADEVMITRQWVPLSDDFSNNGTKWYYERISTDSVMNVLYNKTSSLGANAFTRFTAEMKFIRNGEALIPYWEVSGFAIKRKNIN
jgi:hypothetical protein